MKKDEMVSVLAIAGADSRTIDAMAEAYEMGFDYGSRAYVHLTEALEHAKNLCERVDRETSEGDDSFTGDFWKAMKKLQELE